MNNPFGALFERRSIGSSHELLQYLLKGGLSTISGQVVNETKALNVAAVYTGVAIRSRLLGALPVDVIEKVGTNSEQRPNHPIARVLSQPNRDSLRQTKTEFFGMLEAHRLLRGNGYAWINRATVPMRDGDERIQVVEMIPLHPDQVEVLDAGDEFGPTNYKLHRKSGQPLPLPSIEVLHVKGMTTNGRTGRSFIADMRDVIGGALATQEHANRLWSGDGNPAVTLSHPKTLSDKAKKNIEETWEATYGRTKERRRVAILEEGMELTQVSLSPEDGQFLETRQDLRAEIAAALMVPPHLMGLSEKATTWGTGIAEQNIGLLTITLGPDIRMWEERLAMDLVTNQARFQIKFNERALQRGSFASQIETLVKGIQGGIFSVNEARSWFDLDPIPEGDTHLQPVNFAPLGFVPLPKGGAQN